jgi:2-oxo-3-hexenedioate decarboxylase
MAATSDIAAELIDAARTRRALPRPFTERGELDVETAYAIQQEVVDARLAEGSAMIGAKLGLTSLAKQRQMGVDRPLYGWLTGDMVHPLGSPLDLSRFIHPRAEPEIAFLLGAEIAAPANAETVLAATESVVPAIEIIDSRYDGFRFRHADVIADNASSAAFVIGDRPRPVDEVGDLRTCPCVLRVDGQVVATAVGAAVLGHPAESVAWLVNELHRRGRRLAAGSLVLSGALTDAVPITAGSTVSAEFDGLGAVELHA